MKKVKDLLDKLGKLEEAPLIWINKKLYDMPKIINELEKWLEEEIKQPIEDPAEREYVEGIKASLYKLQELKGKYNNV